MAIAKVLCNAFQDRKRARSRSNEYAGLVRSSISPSSVKQMRYTTLQLIYSLSAGGDTRYNHCPQDGELRMHLLYSSVFVIWPLL